MRTLVIAFCVALTACSNPTSSFIVAPQVFWSQSNALQGADFALQVVDARTSDQTFFLRNGNAVSAKQTSNNLVASLEGALTQALQAQGARVAYSAPTSITVQILSLNADADQRTVEHLVKNEVALKLVIENGAGSFDKVYSGKSTFSGPFKLDSAVAEGKLRVLTEQVLAELLKDTSWHSYAKG